MFRLFSQFGRARELRLLDQELRAVGVHPVLMPEAVKLTTMRLLKQAERGLSPEAIAEAAAILGYCMQGHGLFAEENGPDFAGTVEGRFVRAIDTGDSLDAQVILLALHAGLVQESVVERYGLEVAAGEPPPTTS